MTATVAEPVARYQLVEGVLSVEIEEALLPLVSTSWLPRGLSLSSVATPAVIRVACGQPAPPPKTARPAPARPAQISPPPGGAAPQPDQ